MAAAYPPHHASLNPHSMHPFFTSAGKETHLPASDSQTFNLDGSADSSSQHPICDARVGNLQQQDRVEANSQTISQGIDPTQLSPADISRSEVAAVDSSDDRRKRRKVSGEVGIFTGNNKYLSTSDESLKYKNSLCSNTDHNVREKTPEGFQNQSSDVSLPTRKSPRSTKKVNPNDFDTTKEPLSRLLPVASNAVLAQSGVVPDPASAIPKKKMLKLGGNGRLLSPEQTTFSKPSKGQRAKEKGDKAAVVSGAVQLRNGKLAQSLVVKVSYGNSSSSKLRIAERIDSILSKAVSCGTKQESNDAKKLSVTHPFFMGKPASRTSSNVSNIVESTPASRPESDQPSGASLEINKPVPWKDIVFKKVRATTVKDTHAIPAIWPPLDIAHVGQISRIPQIGLSRPRPSEKQKAAIRTETISPEHNIVTLFSNKLRAEVNNFTGVEAPQRRLLESGTVIKDIDEAWNRREPDQLISRTRSHALKCKSAFDRAESPGPLVWTHQYAPTESIEVLQPSCPILRDWLKSLAVHNVKQGLDQVPLKTIQKKKGRSRKRGTEIDDFIVDDEDEAGTPTVCNSILLTGPNGCGKTASVFAVARELGFEIFEIHPGMRRSAKDILDKVGDMAQNHLVHRGESMSRGSSVAPGALDTPVENENAIDQPSVTNFFGALKKITAKTISRPETPQPKKKEQKQSLILFEEADIVFDEDRGFWACVQNLIKSSRRPVVITCNDRSKIPEDEIDFHAILDYSSPPEEVVIRYLSYLAVAEGHIIQPQAMLNLYRSKRHDLRATIMELNFWCQMTVGSAKGGLDWFKSPSHGQQASSLDNLRTFSENTYHSGLDLYPQISSDPEDNLRYAQASLDLDFPTWDICGRLVNTLCASDVDIQKFISQYELMTSYHSCMDLMDPDDVPTMASSIASILPERAFQMNRDWTTAAYITSLRPIGMAGFELFGCMDPLLDEKPVFPPSQGRLAPSLDCSRWSIATDVAPYVRSILHHERDLEEQREILYGSQSKRSRNTRAARAAAEGGNIASTRPEKWFSDHLDVEKILSTGPGWPHSPSNDSSNAGEAGEASEAAFSEEHVTYEQEKWHASE